MKIGKSILDFLFGKDPAIFDENGEVVHDLGDTTWKQWANRYNAPEYNWRQHSGTRPNLKKNQETQKKELAGGG